MGEDDFDGFESRIVGTPRGEIFARIGGSGPPMLLLHGYPETHLGWHAVAPLLRSRFTVIVPDLPGYGRSFRPTPSADHRAHSKRALAADLVEFMERLGYEQWVVVGHDRGGRIAYRMALDSPLLVTAVAVLDVVPTGDVWRLADAALALGYWHWSFLAQPAPLPERMIGGDPQAFFDYHGRALGLGSRPGRYPDAVMTTYRAILDDASTVEAICEDYRAGATVDRADDDADRGRRRIACPLLALWSANGALPRFYGDPMRLWRDWAADATGRGLDTGHFLAEDAPDEVADELIALAARATPAAPDAAAPADASAPASAPAPTAISSSIAERSAP